MEAKHLWEAASVIMIKTCETDACVAKGTISGPVHTVPLDSMMLHVFRCEVISSKWMGKDPGYKEDPTKSMHLRFVWILF